MRYMWTMIVGSAGHRQTSKLYMKAQNPWGSPKSLAQSRFNKRSPHYSVLFVSLYKRPLRNSPPMLWAFAPAGLTFQLVVSSSPRSSGLRTDPSGTSMAAIGELFQSGPAGTTERFENR
jgi:hypothetical protein